MTLTLAKRAERIRSIDRAREALKPGDKIAFTSCPGTPRTATFEGWDGNWICSKTRSDIAASSIFKLNGKPVSFGDPAWERYDPDTGRTFGDHGTAVQAMEWAFNNGGLEWDIVDFLGAWRDGSAWEEWPEFYEWLTPWPAERARRQNGALSASDLDEVCF